MLREWDPRGFGGVMLREWDPRGVGGVMLRDRDPDRRLPDRERERLSPRPPPRPFSPRRLQSLQTRHENRWQASLLHLAAIGHADTHGGRRHARPHLLGSARLATPNVFFSDPIVHKKTLPHP